MNLDEVASLVEFKVANITFKQIKDAIQSLEDDHTNRNMLVQETRSMKLEDVGGAYMLIIFKYVQAEVINDKA
jgi:hypothetical protein